MMSLEEALEMDRLPYSAGLSEQISTSTEFPVWLQRTAPVSKTNPHGFGVSFARQCTACFR